MSNDDFKKLLDEAIKPLREDITGIKGDITDIKGDVTDIRGDITGIRGDIKRLEADQADLRGIIEERVLPPLIYIETTVKGYADQYVTNKDHIRRLDKRLNTVEEDLGIQPPQELIIPAVD